jgi:L-ascorbate peroxidase
VLSYAPGPHDASVKEPWPAQGGADGSIRFSVELGHGANAGLINAVKLLEPVKEACPAVSYADIYQMASARAIELAGGPKIDMKYGRLDTASPDECPKEGNLPDAEAGPGGKFGGAGGTASSEDPTAEGHLRKVFYRMGLDDEAIVALSGAHTFGKQAIKQGREGSYCVDTSCGTNFQIKLLSCFLGRAYKDRSGLGAEKTKFTDGASQMRADGKEAKYTPGGSSWTDKWLIFDNSYFHILPDEKADPELLKLSSDKVVFTDAGFKPFAEKFRDSQDAFFESYKKAHKALSELGSKFDPAEGITLD